VWAALRCRSCSASPVGRTAWAPAQTAGGCQPGAVPAGSLQCLPSSLPCRALPPIRHPTPLACLPAGVRLHSFCDASLKLPCPTLMVVPDTLQDARFQLNQFVSGSCCCIPECCIPGVAFPTGATPRLRHPPAVPAVLHCLLCSTACCAGGKPTPCPLLLRRPPGEHP
jgi:hypothetical protein